MLKFIPILLLSVLLIGCGDDFKCQPEVQVPKGTVSVSDKKQQLTPKGAIVASENGVTADKLNEADAGLTLAFQHARESGWADNGRAYDYSRYKIYIPVQPCIPSPSQQIPSFLVRGDNYDGSVYDHYNTQCELPIAQQNNWNKYVPDGIGVVYAAEMVLSYDNGTTQMNSFVTCPEAPIMQNGSEYGAEHTLAYQLDMPYYLLTQTHSVIGHPILPKRSSKGLEYYAAPTVPIFPIEVQK